jgi:hypothetical protein
MGNNIDSNNGLSMSENNGIVNFNNITHRESKLRKILDIMLSQEIDELPTPGLSKYDTEEYTIEDKISFNCLNKDWTEILYDFVAFETIIDNALVDDENGISQKSRFLKTLKYFYKKAKKELHILNNQDEICKHSTDILDLIQQYHIEFLKTNNENKEHYDESCISILVAFGFIECKILEKPTH